MKKFNLFIGKILAIYETGNVQLRCFTGNIEEYGCPSVKDFILPQKFFKSKIEINQCVIVVEVFNEETLYEIVNSSPQQHIEYFKMNLLYHKYWTKEFDKFKDSPFFNPLPIQEEN